MIDWKVSVGVRHTSHTQFHCWKVPWSLWSPPKES